MNARRWAAADLETELDALERAIESAGLGPARTIEFADGAVAVVDACGRAHEVLAPQSAGALLEAA